MNTPAQHILVTDFDGTMTQFDFFDLVLQKIPSQNSRDFWAEYVDGKITHFEALAGIFGDIRASTAQIQQILTAMHLDPALNDSVTRLQAAGWDIIVASAGCAWYIEQLLSTARVKLEIHANPGTFSPATGLRLTLPTQSAFFKRETGIDKCAIVRAALDRDPDAIFAGDGRPDLDPALLVKPQNRYATGWLAHHLQKIGEPFRPFDTWSQIAHSLLEKTP